MIIKDHELCRVILSSIYKLREDLVKLEQKNPLLFSGSDPIIESECEYCNADSMLESIELQLEHALKESENRQAKKLIRNL